MNNNFQSSTFTWALDTTAATTAIKKPEEPFGLSDADLFQFLLGEEAEHATNSNSSISSNSSSSSSSNSTDIVMKENQRTTKKKATTKPVITSTTSRLDFRPMNDSIPESQLKCMTSKERRQLRNKISARNFRNRRKEYVGTLEEQLNDSKAENNRLVHELKWAKEKIERLEKENDKLRLDLMLGGMMLPIQQQENSPNNYPSSLVHSSLNFSASSSSSDESNLSSPPNLFMDFPDNWDFVLPQDITATTTTNNTTTTTTNFQDSYIASAIVPDWNINQVLSKETSLVSTSNHQLLLRQYPLLAPALMSIVIAHTMAMSTDELLATSKLNTTTVEPLLKDNFFVDKPVTDATVAAGVMSDKEAKAVWSILEPLTLLNERNAKITGTEGTVTTTIDTTTPPSSSECRTKICEFYETKVIPYCPIAWFQSRVCKSVCEYVASNCIWNNNNTSEEPKSIKSKPLICRQFQRAKRYITTCE